MKDRLIGMMGTLGLVLVLISLMPPASAFAFGGSGGGGCTGGCGTIGFAGKNLCNPLHACEGKNLKDAACGITNSRNMPKVILFSSQSVGHPNTIRDLRSNKKTKIGFSACPPPPLGSLGFGAVSDWFGTLATCSWRLVHGDSDMMTSNEKSTSGK
jgi:hypothetical protein